ncbi:ureidoglycolate lyase [Fluviibacterium sp. DFM31]|uniref:Ureidoglycolate lyase n=1 Tax=Meridianimarinicoccus marinus TaxID=3231483 RepID=A0ABV3L178_9RHOB
MSGPHRITAEPLTRGGFARYGDVLKASGAPDRWINRGLCGRYHDLALLDFGAEGRAGISLFKAVPRNMPYALDLVERHPEGSQAFLPMSPDPFLVTVAEDGPNGPEGVRAFLTEPGQGVNFHRGVWHGVLTPLSGPGLFAVVDRIGPGRNLEEVSLNPRVLVTRG